MIAHSAGFSECTDGALLEDMDPFLRLVTVVLIPADMSGLKRIEEFFTVREIKKWSFVQCFESQGWVYLFKTKVHFVLVNRMIPFQIFTVFRVIGIIAFELRENIVNDGFQWLMAEFILDESVDGQWRLEAHPAAQRRIVKHKTISMLYAIRSGKDDQHTVIGKDEMDIIMIMRIVVDITIIIWAEKDRVKAANCLGKMQRGIRKTQILITVA